MTQHHQKKSSLWVVALILAAVVLAGIYWAVTSLSVEQKSKTLDVQTATTDIGKTNPNEAL